MCSTARAWLTALALVGSLVMFAAAPSASAELVGQMSWSVPFNIDPPPTSGYIGRSLSAVSCPSESLCVAVDAEGNVLTSTEPANSAGAWTVTHVDDFEYEETCESTPCGVPRPSPASFEGIACPTTSLCIAWDQLGDIFASTDPTGGATAWSGFKIAPRYSFSAMACPTTSLCVATGTEEVFTSIDPAGGAGAWHSASVDVGPCPYQAHAGCHGFSRNIGTVSCPSASLCVAADWDGDVLTTSEPANAAAWHVEYVDHEVRPSFLAKSSQAGIGAMTCPDSSHCIASDDSGNVLTSMDPTGGTAAWKLARFESDFAANSVPLSCPSVTRCVRGVDQILSLKPDSLAVNYDTFGGGEWNPVSIVSGFIPIAISCPSEQLCVSVNDTGGVIVGRAEVLSDARLKVLLRNASHAPPRPTTKTLHRTGSYTESFTPPLEGSIRIRWLAHPAGRPRAKQHSIASGAYVFHSVAARYVVLRVTPFGRKLLRRHHPVTVTEQITYTPLEGSPVTVTTRFRLRG